VLRVGAGDRALEGRIPRVGAQRAEIVVGVERLQVVKAVVQRQPQELEGQVRVLLRQ
jgi:hypothetical protein